MEEGEEIRSVHGPETLGTKRQEKEPCRDDDSDDGEGNKDFQRRCKEE